jgi:hypothetical protein
MFLLLGAAIEHAQSKRKNFDSSNAKSQEIVDECVATVAALTKYFNVVADAEFIERFGEWRTSGVFL